MPALRIASYPGSKIPIRRGAQNMELLAGKTMKKKLLWTS